jgi:hypothetical protein
MFLNKIIEFLGEKKKLRRILFTFLEGGDP